MKAFMNKLEHDGIILDLSLHNLINSFSSEDVERDDDNFEMQVRFRESISKLDDSLKELIRKEQKQNKTKKKSSSLFE